MEPEIKGLSDFNRYLSNLLPEVGREQTQDYQKSGAIKKALEQIETDLESYNKNLSSLLSQGNPGQVELCKEKLELLKRDITSKVEHYHIQHSGISGKIKKHAHAKWYGSINTIRDKVLTNINKIQKKIGEHEVEIHAAAIKSSPMLQKPTDLPLMPEDTLSQILSYLPDKDFTNLSQAIDSTKAGEAALTAWKVAASREWIKRAQEFGYKGKDSKEAKNHLNQLNHTLDFIKSSWGFSQEQKWNGRLQDKLKALAALPAITLSQVLYGHAMGGTDVAKQLIDILIGKNKQLKLFEACLSSPLQRRDGDKNYLADLLKLINSCDVKGAIGPQLLHSIAKKNSEFLKSNQYNFDRVPELYDNLEVIKVLLEKGVDVNCTDNFGDTVLHHAVLTKNSTVSGFDSYSEELIKLLLSYGADIHAANNVFEHETPLNLTQNIHDGDAAAKLEQWAKEYQNKKT